MVLAVMLKMFFAMQLEKDRVFVFSWGGVLVPSSRGTFLIEELQEFLLKRRFVIKGPRRNILVSVFTRVAW